jgi:hypothetical protein
MFQTTPAGLATFLLILAGSGIVLIKAGLWPRRRGTEHRCRKCSYVVDNISSERCPECGNLLHGRGTAKGHRYRRPLHSAAGVLLLVLFLGWGARQIYQSVNWYQHKPARWVVKDLAAGDAATQDRAWSELMRRRGQGQLSKGGEERFTDALLADRQLWTVTPSRARTLIFGSRYEQSFQILWDQLEAGKLTPAQADHFFRNLSTRIPWVIRPLVLVGQDIPYAVDGGYELPNLPSRGWWMRVGLVGGTGEDDIITEGSLPSSPWQSWILLDSAKKTAGEHDVEIHYFAAYYRGPYRSDEANKQKPIWRGEFIHHAKVKVLTEPTGEFMKLVDAPELAEEIKGNIRIEKFTLDPARSRYHFTFQTTGPPMNAAFEMLVSMDGKEYPLGNLTMPRSGHSVYNIHIGAFPSQVKPQRVDLIFRTDRRLAEKTVDMVEVWKGELVLKDVSIKEGKVEE